MELKLRGKRVEHGLNQTDMAKILGITQNSYSRKELGLSPFTLDEIRKILKLFKCKFEDIFFTE